MKNITLIVFVIIVSFTIFPSSAQSLIATRYQYINNIKITEDNRINGTPYVNEKFVPARVIINDEETIYNARYNAYLDIIELEDQNMKTFSINKSVENLTITLLDTGDVFELIKYLEGYTIKESYFVHMSPASNKVKLFKKSNIKLIPAKPSFNGYDKARKAAYVRTSDEYYIKIGEENLAVLAPRRKKDIAKLLPDHKSEILKFVKENKIKTSREEDLIELVNYLNTL